jgi:TetR/AcrR family transcriptional regulator, transcriptional repressor for nem operon
VSSTQTSPTDTREQIVRVAREMIMTRSYLGFSFQDIADRVGIRKPSLYHHFPTKDALAREVLERSTLVFRAWSQGLALPAAKKLDAYIRMYRDTLGAGHQVCPAGAFAPGWDCIQGELQQAVRELRNAQVDWLATVFSELGVRAPRARARASYLFATCQGALIAARMTGAVADFDDVLATARKSLEV